MYKVRLVTNKENISEIWYVLSDIQDLLDSETPIVTKTLPVPTPFGLKKLECVNSDTVFLKENIWTFPASYARISIKGEMISAEKLIEEKFCEFLQRKKIAYTRQMQCKFGRADIVTDTYIFEVKPYLTFHTATKAVSQLKIYRDGINKNACLCVISSFVDDNAKTLLAKEGVNSILFKESGKFSSL